MEALADLLILAVALAGASPNIPPHPYETVSVASAKTTGAKGSGSPRAPWAGGSQVHAWGRVDRRGPAS